MGVTPPKPIALSQLPALGAYDARALDGGERAWLSVPLGQHGLRLLLVRHGDQTLMFLNRCPHAGHPLELATGDIWNRRRDRLMCGSHQAEFRLPDGLCVSGPCRRSYLRRVVDDRPGCPTAPI